LDCKTWLATKQDEIYQIFTVGIIHTKPYEHAQISLGLALAVHAVRKLFNIDLTSLDANSITDASLLKSAHSVKSLGILLSKLKIVLQKIRYRHILHLCKNVQEWAENGLIVMVVRAFCLT